MPKDVRYAVKRGKKYLQGVRPNEDYNPYAVAPTMGNRHLPCEASSVWGDEPVYFEPYTLANHIQSLMEEYRWDGLLPVDVSIKAKVVNVYAWR